MVVSFSIFRIMRAIAAQLSYYLCRRRAGVNMQSCNLSTYSGKDELSIEQEAERKIGWLLKMLFFGTASVEAYYQFFPYMDERRVKIVEPGGAEELLNMLSTAKDDRTRKAALKALAALSQSDYLRIQFKQYYEVDRYARVQPKQCCKH